MINLIWIALFLPLCGFIGLLCLADKVKRSTASAIGCTTILLSFLCFLIFSMSYLHRGMDPFTPVLFSWIQTTALQVDFSLYVDQLSLVMTLVITGVGFLIHLYSIGYTKHEEDFTRYFACMNFFVFAMLTLVLGGHLLTLFLGWELVGLASYLLIGYWYTRPTAAAAATKAFVMNRIADLGLIVGILLTLSLFGTGSFTELLRHPEQQSSALLTLITLLFFIGAIGKSAQLPLHTWLPDAMEGPTPVSALIHAATMVTAGVYLMIRMHLLLELAPLTSHIIACTGTLTALFAALCALGQTDLKRVLAYSTISQLGFMFAACGIGAFFIALFHLVTHAFMKSLLFLCAGNVIHIMNTTQMEKMGGLKTPFRITHLLFLIGALAMSGVPPLAAFFSKDLILDAVFDHAPSYIYLALVASSLFTAIYLTRAYCLTFLGAHQTDREMLKGVKEAPLIMLAPCGLLCLGAAFGGFFGSPLQNLFSSAIESVSFSLSTWISLAVSFLGVGVTWIVYTRYPYRLGKTSSLLKQAFYIDKIYEKIIATPLRMLSSFVIYIVEPKFFTRMIQAVAALQQTIAALLQRLQTGQTRGYFGWLVTGVMILFGLMLLH